MLSSLVGPAVTQYEGWLTLPRCRRVRWRFHAPLAPLATSQWKWSTDSHRFSASKWRWRLSFHHIPTDSGLGRTEWRLVLPPATSLYLICARWGWKLSSPLGLAGVRETASSGNRILVGVLPIAPQSWVPAAYEHIWRKKILAKK